MIWFWLGFFALVALLLFLDLGVVHRRATAMSLRTAAMWTAGWIGLGLAFSGVVYLMYENNWAGVHLRGQPPTTGAGADATITYISAYLLEQALSIDNIFVMSLVFRSFNMPLKYQHRVLFWGILGALVMRGAFIAAGTYLLQQCHWVIYVFGAILLVTGVKLALRSAVYDPADNPVLKLARRVLPLTPHYHGERFWVKEGARWVATPLFLVLLLVEATDLVFAVDSIPAIFAVTDEPFLVYTANVFAILGLRSMYFLLAGVVHRFVYLKYGLAAVLVFVGAKMMLVDLYKVPVVVSLVVVGALIAGSIVASLWRPPSSMSFTPPPRPSGGDAPRR